MASSLIFNRVSFTYPQSTQTLLHDVNLDLHNGWWGLVGDNGAGKSTLIHLALGKLSPLSGNIKAPAASFCPQETREKPPGLESYLEALYGKDNRAGKLFSLLALDHDWPYRWESLSHGERKRFQLACVLWEDREFLAVDEPTNHLDDTSRRLILASLKEYDGIGLIISHDRDFMEELCPNCLFLRSNTVTLRPGTLSQGWEQEERERREMVNKRALARQEVKRLEQEAASRRRLAEGQQKRRSKGGLDIKDHDARFKKNLARISGKDGTGGKLLRQMDGRLAQAREERDSLDGEAFRKTGVTQRSRRFRGDRILYRKEGTVALGEEKVLIHPELVLGPDDRIALTGDNGTGKSSLIKTLLEESDRPSGEILYIPQEPNPSEKDALRQGLAELNDRDKGALVSYFSRLGGTPESLLESAYLSPGEERKLMLSFGLTREPVLIVLDEPTNHLDLTSILSLEETLAQAECALLLVSHDSRLREKLTNREWRLEADGPGRVILSPEDQAL